jgi:hypothetical protein
VVEAAESGRGGNAMARACDGMWESVGKKVTVGSRVLLERHGGRWWR